MNNYDKFHKCIDNLIKINKDHREAFADHLSLNDEDYIKEFCIVRIDIGRRTGKTEYIRNNSIEPNTLIIVAKNSYKQLYDHTCSVYSDNELESLVGENIKYNTIYIDEPALHDRTINYMTKLGTRDSTFILLGE